MFLDELLHLGLSLTRQVQQVVTPVGGGRLVHGAPDQGPGLALGNIINSQKVENILYLSGAYIEYLSRALLNCQIFFS